MNKLGKLLLVVTSLAPILGAFAVNSLAQWDWWSFGWFLGGGIALVLVCWLVMWRCQVVLPEEPLNTKKVKTADKEVLAFLIVYMLPLFTKDLIFTGNWVTPVYIVGVIAYCVFHSNSFTFNPLLSMAGYHFYEVENDGGMTYLLISRQTLRRQDNALRVKQLGDYIYLEP